MIELHVTSLDVIHSFWAYQLGVKADANPDVDNIAFVKPHEARDAFDVRCAELCGIWHGYMFDHGHVVTPSEFATWIAEQQKQMAPATKVLPKYSTHLPPRTDEARRMSTTAAAAATPQRRRQAAVAAAARLQPAHRRACSAWAATTSAGSSATRSTAQKLRIHGGDRRERRRAAARLLVRRDRLSDRAGLRQLPGLAACSAARFTAREGGRGHRALLRPLHRPQGRRHPVPRRDRRVLLRRRAQRDADPHRAAAPEADVRRPQPVPVAGRHARDDDDGNDDLGHPRPVRQLLRADHDRRPADGLPAHRGAHVLAADGRRLHPRLDDLLRRLPDRLDGL